MTTAADEPANVEISTIETAADGGHEFSSLVLLSSDIWTVVEKHTSEILLYSRSDGKLRGKSGKLESRPWCICHCGVQGEKNMFAVTLDNGQIQILSAVSKDQSVTVTTEKILHLAKPFNCHRGGVKSLKSGDTLLISGVFDGWISWGIVSIENGNGEYFNRICEGKEWSYLATSPDDSIVYISCLAGLDSLNNGVYAFDISTGTRSFVYKHNELKFPGGICVDKDGFIYVCSYSSSIHQLSENGDKLRVYRDETLYGLYAIYWEEQSGDLYVTCYQSNEVRRLHAVFSGFNQEGNLTSSSYFSGVKRLLYSTK